MIAVLIASIGPLTENTSRTLLKSALYCEKDFLPSEWNSTSSDYTATIRLRSGQGQPARIN